jgi:hypothetical protein
MPIPSVVSKDEFQCPPEGSNMHFEIQFRFRRVLRVLAVLAVALVVFSCSSDKPTAPKITGPNRATPDSLLAVFAKSLEGRKIAMYTECLEDSYTFTFDVRDWNVAGVSANSPFWAKTEDVPRMAHMLGDTLIQDIEFDWLPPVAVWAACTDSIFDGGHWQAVACSCAVFQPDIKVVFPSGYGGTFTYWVHMSRLTFTVCPDRSDSHLWTILRIKEYYIDHTLMTEPTTFGNIKSMYR